MSLGMGAYSLPLYAVLTDPERIMSMEIREPIKVMAVFDCDIRPVKFKWHGRVYPIKEITHTWSSRDGSVRSIHFAVSDGATLFDIAYDTVSMRWTLEGVDG